jgi:predicted small lipoprotein YifL
MKQRIYLSLCVLATVLMTACGQKSQPPTAVVTPPPVAVTPPPVTTTQQTPVPAPTVAASPVPVKVPKLKPTPQEPSTPIISALPKPLYPEPAPVQIPVIPEPNKNKANPKPDPISKLKIPTSPAQQITPVGIGGAKIGMSLKELKEQMGQGFQFPIKASFIEGFDAIAVTKAGAVQYYIPYPAGTQFTDADKIQHLMTDNPNYRTEQGVGPGTSIQQATTVYGGATLSLSKENESREFINFTQHPNGLAFRPKPVGKHNFAGDYPESNDEYLKTQKYDNKAAIGQITVSCAENQCEQDH